MRFAIIASPRSGNSVMRSLFSATYELLEFASHDPRDLLVEYPDNSIVQIHARFDQAIYDHLKAQGTFILTPIRHPLDTLLSMLHFAQFEPEVNNWLGGNYLAELKGRGPQSRQFHDFALGEGAKDLLAVSTDWLPHADLGVRYRDYCDDPSMLLDFAMLPKPLHSRDDPLVRHSVDFARFRSAPNMHGWMGKPDYWKRFIPADFARELHHAHAKQFVMGNFSIDGAQALTSDQIAADWADAFHGENHSTVQQAHHGHAWMWVGAGAGAAVAGVGALSYFF